MGVLEQSTSGMRVGTGYDIHRLLPGHELILGGVSLEHPEGKGLTGHSDADVLTHAVMDAVLGAAGLPDIGQLFPDNDPDYRGVSSLKLLYAVAEKLRAEGWCIQNLDVTVLAERPQLAPHLSCMSRRVASVLAVDQTQINIKAKTNEKLDAVGREDAIAAHAVALLACECR